MLFTPNDSDLELLETIEIISEAYVDISEIYPDQPHSEIYSVIITDYFEAGLYQQNRTFLAFLEGMKIGRKEVDQNRREVQNV